MSSIHENGCEKLAQDTRKVNENGEKGQDKVKESGNNNLVENVAVAVAVGELGPGGEHRDSPCPIVIKEDTPVPSYIDNLPLETDTKDDGLLKTNTETIHGDKNSQLEKSPHLSLPSVSLDPEKGLIIPIMESLLEENKESGQVSLDLSKLGGDSVKVGKDNPVDEDKMVILPNNEPVEDNVRGPIKKDREILIEQDIASIEPDNKPLGDHNKCAADSGIETLKVTENRTADAESMTYADNEKGPVQPCTETDFEKGPTTSNCETQSKHGNETSKPVMVTSTNLEKVADMPATDASTDNDKRPDALAAGASRDHGRGPADMCTAQTSSYHEKGVSELEAEAVEDMKDEVPDSKVVPVNGEPAADSEKRENFETPQRKDGDTENASKKHDDTEPGTAYVTTSNIKSEEERSGALNNGAHGTDSTPPTADGMISSKHSFLLDDMSEGNESGTEEEQSAFMKELENFFRERNMEFRPPKFYGEGLNCLKLWRAVTRLGGYDKVTTCKLWRQVGESFRPPKTCTTVSWTFRGFYEKALLEYERHKVSGGELHIPLASHSEPMNVDNQASGSGRARRDAAARAMQGWHSQRLLGNGEVSDPIIKDKSSVPQQKREKQIVTPGLLKRKKLPSTEQAAKIARTQVSKALLDVTVVDLGPPADWVKINVQRTKDCFEVYALVPGLLREEVRVQSDPAGRLVISGEPENPDNLWGATPFKKVVSLPTRIDPHHTSAVVTLNGQLFVRVPLEESD